MHYILTALKSEAKPIIDCYDLVFDNSHSIPIYKNDIYTLLITGVGKVNVYKALTTYYKNCLLYTSPSPRDKRQSRMPSSA